ncbi:hypothetical protein BDM02DRAFT_1219843 [Thelephora ganbajun]|uniref:Uncharacterized protein n=1 Tax=Thelephora ganbajun TaxID=370292 RepID=A0ACB6ZNC9_THEGA|nr:hypothetical protein BDM02DRAFT_1219843 [Thelephora ganbajun]
MDFTEPMETSESNDGYWDRGRTTTRKSTTEWIKANINEKPSSPDGWSTCAKTVQKYDENIVRNWKEEIDTLLVFAGLFSAIVTAFIIESYRWLSQNPQDTAVELLAEISAKLNGNTPTKRFEEPLTLAANNVPFSAPLSAVVINSLWFVSLVVALSSAFIGILVKQWLREYMRPVSATPIDALSLRQLHYQALKDWGVVETISFLPILLQFSLALFLVGLLYLLWTLHNVVAGILTAVIAAVFVFYTATTVLPALHQTSCPYRSPQSWLFLRTASSINRLIFGEAGTRFRTWQDREIQPLRRSSLTKRTMNALLWIDKAVWDTEVLNSISLCLADLRTGFSDPALQFVHRVMAYRVGTSAEALKDTVLHSTPLSSLSADHPLVVFRLRIDKLRGQRLRRILMDSLLWQWSIGSELIHTTPVLSKLLDILATINVLPEFQDSFSADDDLPKRTIICLLRLLEQDLSANPLCSQVQNKALEILAYLSYRTPPACLQEVLLDMITAARGSYNTGPVFLGISTTLIRILARWGVTSFSDPETHREFTLLVRDMRRYFEWCTEQNIPFGYDIVDRWIKRMEMVISRFALTYEDKQELKAIITALEKGSAFGLTIK